MNQKANKTQAGTNIQEVRQQNAQSVQELKHKGTRQLRN